MRSRRPRGVDLDRHDLTAEAQQMRFSRVSVSMCGYFCAQICVGVLKSVWMCVKQKEMRGKKCEMQSRYTENIYVGGSVYCTV